jgi:hypothetical protein
LDVLCGLFYVLYWFLRKGGPRSSKFPKSQKPVPGILGEFLGNVQPRRIRMSGIACFLEEMSTSMTNQFNFVNIAGNAFNTNMDELMEQEYEINVSTAAAA